MLPKHFFDLLGIDNLPHTSLLTGGGIGDWEQAIKVIQAKLDVNDIDVVSVVSPPAVKEISEVLSRAYYRPKNSKYSVMFLFSMNQWSAECMNKILRISEEPPYFLRIFMFSRSQQGVLPTILSRAQLFKLTDNKFTQKEAISLHDILSLPLAEALSVVRDLVEKQSASDIMNHWLRDADFFEAKEITKKATLAGGQPVNQRILLESIIFRIKTFQNNKR